MRVNKIVRKSVSINGSDHQVTMVYFDEVLDPVVIVDENVDVHVGDNV